MQELSALRSEVTAIGAIRTELEDLTKKVEGMQHSRSLAESDSAGECTTAGPSTATDDSAPVKPRTIAQTLKAGVW